MSSGISMTSLTAIACHIVNDAHLQPLNLTLSSILPFVTAGPISLLAHFTPDMLRASSPCNSPGHTLCKCCVQRDHGVRWRRWEIHLGTPLTHSPALSMGETQALAGAAQAAQCRGSSRLLSTLGSLRRARFRRRAQHRLNNTAPTLIY